jgi:hypothetical protein
MRKKKKYHNFFLKKKKMKKNNWGWPATTIFGQGVTQATPIAS